MSDDEEPTPSIEGVVYQMLHQSRLMAMSHPEISKALKAAALDFWERPENERNSVLSTLRTNLKSLALPTMREILGHDDETD
jgi:hypothetical protein